LRSVFIFSGKLGAASSGLRAVASGGAEGLAVSVGTAGACAGALTGARLGGVCFAR
jgi:hypothetical protein